MLDIRVSEGASRLFLHYDHREVGNEPFGHMLENRVLRCALLERAQEMPALVGEDLDGISDVFEAL